MDRLIIAAAVIAAAAIIALVAHRRRPDAPSSGSYDTPTQLDRGDFADPSTTWLVAVFTSSSCASCEAVWSAVGPLAGADVVTQQIEIGDAPDLHARYRIEAVPATVIADPVGVVRAAFLGPVDRAAVSTALDGLEAE